MIIKIPDDPSNPVLVRDVVLGKQGVGLLLVELHTNVPGVVAVHLVQLAGVGAVHAHKALQVRPFKIGLFSFPVLILLILSPGLRTLDSEVSVDGLILVILHRLGCAGVALTLTYTQTLKKRLH